MADVDQRQMEVLPDPPMVFFRRGKECEGNTLPSQVAKKESVDNRMDSKVQEGPV